MLRRDGGDGTGRLTAGWAEWLGCVWRGTGREGEFDGVSAAAAADGDALGQADLADCVGGVSGGGMCRDDVVRAAAGLAGTVQRARWEGHAAGVAGACRRGDPL